MTIFKKLVPLTLALTTTACLNLDLTGVEIGGLEPDPSMKISKFRCENGYKVSVYYKSEDLVRVAFNDGKDTYVPDAKRVPSASGALYANDRNTLKWHEKNDTGILTYPAADYGTSKKLLDTVCHKTP